MTRQEFDARYAATQSDTEGFTDEQLTRINDAVFAEVAAMDIDDDRTDSHVKNMFARAFDAEKARTAARQIVKEAGEPQEIDMRVVRKITEARTAFLDKK